jgi:hypothetical protein
VEALNVEAGDFSAAGDVPEAVAFYQRGATDALQRPIVDAASGQFLAAVLPEELAVFNIEREQHAEIHVGRVALKPAAAVIRAHKYLAVHDHGIAVSLRTETRHPFDVLRSGLVPLASAVVKVADLPFRRYVVADGSIVARGSAAPLIPVDIGFLGGTS